MVIWNILSILVIGCVGVIHGRQLFKFAALAVEYRRRSPKVSARESFAELMEFSRAFYEFSPAMQEKVGGIKDTFLRESVTAFLHGGVVGHELLRTLRQKADQKFEHDISIMHDVNFLMRGLPALGWAVAIGSTIWMFNTGGEPISFERATSAFSMTMGAVFYGLGITYLVAMPLMERVWRAAREERAKNCLLVEGIGHLMRKKSPFELYETIQILIPGELRPEWESVFADKVKQVA